MHKYNTTASGHHDVGLAWKIRAVKGEAATETMEDRADDPLRSGVLAFDGPHARAALGGGEVVGHRSHREFEFPIVKLPRQWFEADLSEEFGDVTVRLLVLGPLLGRGDRYASGKRPHMP